MHHLKNRSLLSLIIIAFILTSFATKDIRQTQKVDVQIPTGTTSEALVNNSADANFSGVSYQSSYANKNIALAVMKGRTQEEAWEIVRGTVLSYFDVLESDDERSGYMRTAWVGTSFSRNTTRHRVIIRKNGNNPIKYSLKFTSQESGRNGTSYTDDAKFKNVNRIPNRYDGFVEELMTKLQN